MQLVIDYRGADPEPAKKRAANMLPVNQRILHALLTDPDVYTRPDRKRGQWAMERGGYLINWTPGYPGYAGYTKERATASGVFLVNRRPYHPVPTAHANAEFVRWGADYIVSGIA